MKGDYYDVEDAAKRYGVNKFTVYRWCRFRRDKPRMPHHKAGGLRFTKENFEQWDHLTERD